MNVRAIELESSPRGDECTRLRARVEYESGSPASEEYWLDVPNEHADALPTTGDPWLCWLAPLAATMGESLTVHAPVDGLLLKNVRDLIGVWTSWYSHLHNIQIRVESSEELVELPADKTAAFFSGGVDSFFTALRHTGRGELERHVPLDTLIFVWGFDIDILNGPAWETALASNIAVAHALDLSLIPVVTNLRETRFAEADWTKLTHGAALGGVAQALSGRFRTVLVPSSASLRDIRPWGSHPHTDPLFSSTRLRVVHDGAEYRRAEKTESIARSDLALQHLRVCYRSTDGTNCGECKRCYRTMLALEAVGALERCATFRRGALDLRRAERMYCRDATDVKQFGFVRDLAVKYKRDDIIRVIDRSLERSRRMNRLVAGVRALRDKPLFWRWAPTWEQRLLRQWVD
jgi:hypothetical protein